MSGASNAELRRIAQGIRLTNILTVVQLLNKDARLDEATLRTKAEEAALFIEWCKKLVQESVQDA